MKYKKIINSTQEELEKRYHWLAKAYFEGAVIEDKGGFIVWRGGVWRGGTWEGGIWEGGRMWSNIDQKYIDIIQCDGKFKLK